MAAVAILFLEPLACAAAIYKRHSAPLPIWTIYCIFLIPFRWSWLLAPMGASARTIRPDWAVAMLDVGRCAVTAEAIWLLLYAILLGDPQRSIRWQYSIFTGLGGSLLAYAVQSTLSGMARVGCFVALGVALLLSALWLHPVVPYQLRHALVMFAFLGSSAFASMARSVRGDEWDAAAMIVQAGCSAASIGILFTLPQPRRRGVIVVG